MNTSLSHTRHSCADAGTDEHTHAFTGQLARQRSARTERPTMSASGRSAEPKLGHTERPARSASPFCSLNAALPCGRTLEVSGPF